MAEFVGRQVELQRLDRHLRAVRDDGEGVLLSIRGRRQVGKSRLVEEFLRRAEVPSVFFTAARRRSTVDEVESFAAEVAASSLEAAPFFTDSGLAAWEPALRLLAGNLTRPTVVVLDEFPFLLEADQTPEGVLQRVWDRHLSRAPVLMILVGSDLSMMEALGRYDRPLYHRMREMTVEPLTPAETATMLRLDPAAALEAYLVHGGFPTLARAWAGHPGTSRFLAEQLADATSPLVVAGERILNVEFPPDLQARTVLEVIGTGRTTFGVIGSRSGVSQGSLSRTLGVLLDDKQVVAVDRPLSARRTRNALYRVADPYLRFWLRFIGPNLELLYRGRGDLLTAQVAAEWPAYRGLAIEPLVRASIERLLPRPELGDARYVGSYWTRTGDVEVDLVGGRDAHAPTSVSFVGSVTWREAGPFARRDLADLAAARARVPGAGQARMVGVSRSGFTTGDLDLALAPADLVAAWESPPERSTHHTVD